MPDFEDDYEGAELDMTEPYDIEHPDPEDDSWSEDGFDAE